MIDISIIQVFFVKTTATKGQKMANQHKVMKFFIPPLLAELAMDDDFTTVLFRLNSSDDDFNFILQAIKKNEEYKNFETIWIF